MAENTASIETKLQKLSEAIFEKARERFEAIEPAICALLLIEATRVMDLQHVIHHLSEDKKEAIPCDFNVMAWGWNPLVALLLPRMPTIHGIPIQESTVESRDYAHGVLFELGKYALLRKASEMAHFGILDGYFENEKLFLSANFEGRGDHFLDQLEPERLDKLDASNLSLIKDLTVKFEEIRPLFEDLIFPFNTVHGIMVGYNAHPEIDDHFLRIIAERTLSWRNEAGLHPTAVLGDTNGSDVAVCIMLLISFYLKHIQFVNVGRRIIKDVNQAMSLTIWKLPSDLSESLSIFTGIPVKRIEAALSQIVLRKSDAAYFHREGSTLVPLLLEITDGYWLSPVSSIFRNPFQTFRLLYEARFPEAEREIRAERENWMIDDVYHLFWGDRYRLAKPGSIIKRKKQVLTDIDAAIFDTLTGELALFQMKWQDFASNSVRATRSKAKNFVSQVDKWSSSVSSWIEEFGTLELCNRLEISVGSPPSVYLFAVGRTNARFSSYGFDHSVKDTAICSLPQFTRLRLELGSADNVFSTLHYLLQQERQREVVRRPLPYEIEVQGQKIRFENLWWQLPEEEML